MIATLYGATTTSGVSVACHLRRRLHALVLSDHLLLALALVLVEVRALPRVASVAHEHGDGHGPHPPGHRRAHGGHLLRVLVVHVAHQAEPRLLAGVGDRVGAHIDDDRPLLNPVLLHYLGLAAARDDDVGALHLRLRVDGTGVHDGDSGVALQEQHGGGHAHDVGAPQHHRVLPLHRHPAAVQQLDAPLGRAGHEERLAALHAKGADVERVEAIDILLDADGAEDGGLVNVLGEGKLDEDAVHSRVRVEILHNLQELLLGDCLGQFLAERCNAALRALLLLHVNVRLRIAPGAHNHHGKTGYLASLLLQVCDLGLDLLGDRRGDFLAIDHLELGLGLLLPGKGQLLDGISDGTKDLHDAATNLLVGVSQDFFQSMRGFVNTQTCSERLQAFTF
mmetsp:Transcript_9467/g.19601  ORF Transcript_9467/g.19601 Transcript_9467/m.19601 type:complete len:394 (-) Transcript_9467:24-1205(-)